MENLPLMWDGVIKIGFPGAIAIYLIVRQERFFTRLMDRTDAQQQQQHIDNRAMGQELAAQTILLSIIANRLGLDATTLLSVKGIRLPGANHEQTDTVDHDTD